MRWFGGAKSESGHELRSRALTETSVRLPPPPPWATVVAEERGKGHEGRRFGWLPKALVIVGIVLLAGAASVAVYDRVQADILLPGAAVDGLDVGGMSTSAAFDELAARLDEAEDQEVTFKVEDATFTATLGDLGLQADVQGAVDRAHRGADDDSVWTSVAGIFTRTYHRVLDKPVDLDIELAYEFDKEQVQAKSDELGAAVHRDVANAGIDVADGTFKITPSVPGRDLDRGSLEALLDGNARPWALSGGAPVTSDLPVTVIQPEVTKETIGTTLFVNRSERRVYVYMNGDSLQTSFPIAVGTAAYPTPRGTFSVTEVRPNPTWVNPDPTGWGSGMPKSIPPGPGNPLGRFAISISAAGIRFHEGSGVGGAVSHGCMRMHYEDVKQLATYVEDGENGTRVVIV